MDTLHTQAETETRIEKNSIVSHNGETCVVLDVDRDQGFAWIQNTMEIGSRKQDPKKVRIKELNSNGGYGDTSSDGLPALSSVVFEDQRFVSMLPKENQQDIEKASDELIGKTWREVRELQLPSA